MAAWAVSACGGLPLPVQEPGGSGGGFRRPLQRGRVRDPGHDRSHGLGGRLRRGSGSFGRGDGGAQACTGHGRRGSSPSSSADSGIVLRRASATADAPAETMPGAHPHALFQQRRHAGPGDHGQAGPRARRPRRRPPRPLPSSSPAHRQGRHHRSRPTRPPGCRPPRRMPERRAGAPRCRARRRLGRAACRRSGCDPWPHHEPTAVSMPTPTCGQDAASSAFTPMPRTRRTMGTHNR